MGDGGEVGRPGYSREALEKAPPVRSVVPSWPRGSGGVLRVRAVLAVLAAAWSWGWALAVVRVPLGLALAVGLWSAGAGQRSMDPEASAWSIRVGGLGALAGAGFVLYGVPLVLMASNRAGLVGVVSALLAT